MKVPIKAAFFSLVPVGSLAISAMLLMPLIAQRNVEADLEDFQIDSTQIMKASLFSMNLQRQMQEQTEILSVRADAEEETAGPAADTARALADWKRHVVESRDERAEIQSEGNALRQAEQDYAALQALYQKAERLAQEGRREEAAAVLKTDAEALVRKLTSQTDRLIKDEKREIETQLAMLLRDFAGALPFRAGFADRLISLSDHLGRAARQAELGQHLHRQVKEAWDFASTREEEALGHYHGSRAMTRAVLADWTDDLRLAPGETAEQRALHAFRVDLEELDKNLNAAVALTLRGKPDAGLERLKEHVEPLFDDKLVPALLRLWAITTRDIADDIALLRRDARRTRNLLIAFAALILAAGVMGPVVLFRHVVRPLVNLTAAAQEIGRGRLDVSPAARSVFQELETLSAAFDQMAADLRRAEELKAKIVRSEKMASVGQLAGGVAHEINNPLGVILGFAQLAVRKSKEGDPLNEFLKPIEKEALRCKKLVQDLLLFARASNKDAFETVNPNDVVSGCLSLIVARAQAKHVEIVQDIDPGVPNVNANVNQLQQVIINLANNAVDAMGTNGKLVLRTRRSPKAGGAVEIQVQDNGAGIPENIQEKIFEPFFTTKEVGMGTGLGLSLVYEITKRHNGAIGLESAVGKGTTFTVSLPEAKAA